jgi:DNA-binding GntR family transcriptional regulator
MRKPQAPDVPVRTRRGRRSRNSQTMADRAYVKLEELLVTLALPPGTILTESDLIKKSGVGRTPTREALQRLEAFRLVTPLPRHGIMISKVNVTEHLVLLETRRVLDRLVASRAARRATPEQRMALRGLADSMLATAASGNLDEFMRIDHECDLLLDLACHNPSATQAAGPLHIQSRRFWYAFQRNADLARAAKLHHKLLLAVCEGNESIAAAASDALIDYMEEFTRSTFEL